MHSLRNLFAQYPVVSNLILINVLLLVATWVGESALHIDLVDILGLHYPESPTFRPYQVVTHLFMRGAHAPLLQYVCPLDVWAHPRVRDGESTPTVLLPFYGARRSGDTHIG